jgi:hypothetical protein
MTLRINNKLNIRIHDDQPILPDRQIQPNGEIVAQGSSPQFALEQSLVLIIKWYR